MLQRDNSGHDVPQYFQLGYGEQVGTILAGVQKVKNISKGQLYDSIIDVYVKSLQNGWWLMFACAKQEKL
jgi:hypothetical protein